ncbi:thiol:disulfide interchange protein DsbA/DsbL [Marinobacter sp. X15-166B]|uniref:thiol:disulfide interchange protein DsbA/DsbL n=1 Tax=Marinobacter sp. X15-166B TaxID=1897620 RepID=UPI00085C1ECC|nr:thiol:disulfide interchange protein DsbA/DsbL [Marinobacter sp. X15-166B]OEY65747.1 disulfide bond formation protein DsbA [Marinobacter sp. X15-166B]
MKSVARAVVTTVLTAFFAVSALAASYEEGRHYETLSNPLRTETPGKIEVVEAFWYGCPHCYTFKPLIESWEQGLADDVAFSMLPAALGRSWEPHARAFVTLEALGQLDKAHDALFTALASERRPLNTPEALADFVARHGVDAREFLDTYNSFGVNAKYQQAQAKLRGARISGVPTMLVNGKYKVSASTAGGHEQVLKVVDYLIEKERAAAAR